MTSRKLFHKFMFTVIKKVITTMKSKIDSHIRLLSTTYAYCLDYNGIWSYILLCCFQRRPECHAWWHSLRSMPGGTDWSKMWRYCPGLQLEPLYSKHEIVPMNEKICDCLTGENELCQQIKLWICLKTWAVINITIIGIRYQTLRLIQR